MKIKAALAAKNRLEDYLKARKLPIPIDLLSSHYQTLGLDEIDWGIIIGEIQSDTLMLLEWKLPIDEFSTAIGIIDNLRDHGYTEYHQMYRHMVSLWPEEQLKTMSDNASENAWP